MQSATDLWTHSFNRCSALAHKFETAPSSITCQSVCPPVSHVHVLWVMTHREDSHHRKHITATTAWTPVKLHSLVWRMTISFSIISTQSQTSRVLGDFFSAYRRYIVRYVFSHSIPIVRTRKAYLIFYILYRRVPILLPFSVSGFRNFGDFGLFSSNFATTREVGTPMRCVRCCLKLYASFDIWWSYTYD